MEILRGYDSRMRSIDSLFWADERVPSIFNKPINRGYPLGIWTYMRTFLVELWIKMAKLSWRILWFYITNSFLIHLLKTPTNISSSPHLLQDSCWETSRGLKITYKFSEIDVNEPSFALLKNNHRIQASPELIFIKDNK